MAGGNILHKAITYVVNEFVVSGLANSPAFQRFAVRTSKKIEDIKDIQLNKIADQLKELNKNLESCSKKQ